MDRYLLDTTVLIDLSKEVEPVVTGVGELIDASAEIGVCSVVIAEFFSGLVPPEQTHWAAMLERFSYWEVSRAVVMRAGIYRVTYARRGQAISVQNALIAATAVHVGATLLTNNVKDYPMSELSLRRLGR